MTRKEAYGEKVDVYALGVLLWELFARTVLSSQFETPAALEAYARRVACEGHRFPMPHRFPEALSALVARCWAQEADARPTAAQALADLEALQQSGALEGMFGGGGACGCF